MPTQRHSHPRCGIAQQRACLRVFRILAEKSTVWPVLLTWCLLCTILALLPHWWVAAWSERAQEQWFTEARNQAVRLAQEWNHWTAPPPPIITGGEEAVRAWLRREPLVTAVVDGAAGKVWVVDQGRLRPPRNAQEQREPAEWARKAMGMCPRWESGRPLNGVPRGHLGGDSLDAAFWWQVGSTNPNSDTECAIVTFFGDSCMIKRWQPSSPEVEQWLQGTLEPKTSYRFGLFSGFALDERSQKNQRWNRVAAYPPMREGPPRQVTNLDEAPSRGDFLMSALFGDYWVPVLQMTPEVYWSLRSGYLLRCRLAWLSYGLVVLSSGLILTLVLFSQQRDRLQADRLASLAHSLKTPLAVLRLRCETALNNELPRKEQEGQLLAIRAETDQLVATIEAGLETLRTHYAPAGTNRVDGDFFERLDERYTPLFEARERALEVYGSDAAFPCCPSALESALATLVENALIHGKGRVEVEARVEGGLARVSVRDEGPGLPPGALQGARGQAATGEGSHPGQGMALLVLVQLARKEGWGLTFSTEAESFTAGLEIPLRGLGLERS